MATRVQLPPDTPSGCPGPRGAESPTHPQGYPAQQTTLLHPTLSFPPTTGLPAKCSGRGPTYSLLRGGAPSVGGVASWKKGDTEVGGSQTWPHFSQNPPSAVFTCTIAKPLPRHLDWNL